MIATSRCGVHWRLDNLATISPFLGLPIVLRALRGALGDLCGRGLLNTVLTLLVYRRIGEICGKMERLAARYVAGRIWRRVALPGAGLSAGPVVDVAEAAKVRGPRVWPGRFAWLVELAGYRAAGFGAQLRVVLERAEMVEFLVAVPQAGRLLLPVCRMLGLEAALLRPGARSAAPDVDDAVGTAGVVRKRVRVRPAPVDFGRIPLPRGVLSAARRQGFGKRVE